MLRNFIRSMIYSTPLTSNAWQYWQVYPNTPSTCRGVYSSWQEAKAASLTTHKLRKITDIATYLAPKGVAIHSLADRDYPIVFYMREHLKPGTKILNVGGSLAKEYCSYKELLPFPGGIEWRISEVPEVVAVGNKMLKERDYPGVSYSTEIGGEADIFLICGALQYLEPSLPDLLLSLESLPQHVFISRVPMQSCVETFLTVQNIGSTAVPYRIENENSFIKSMNDAGFRLVDGWRDRRKLNIPYYSEGNVSGYLGFYFAQDDAVLAGQPPSVSAQFKMKTD